MQIALSRRHKRSRLRNARIAVHAHGERSLCLTGARRRRSGFSRAHWTLARLLASRRADATARRRRYGNARHGYWNARHGYWNARHGYWSRCVCRLPQRRRWQGLCAIVRNANAAARRIWRAKAGAAGAGLASDVGHRVSSFGWGWCSPQKSVSSRGGNGIKCTLRRRHHLSV